MNLQAMPPDTLHLWFLGNPGAPALVGELNLVMGRRGVSLKYADAWLRNGFPLSEDLPLIDVEHLPREKDTAAGAIDDARPDRWGERVIRLLDRPPRLSLLEYLYYAGDDRFGALGVSMGGARPKALFQLDGEEWVLKFAEADRPAEPLMEHAAMTLAASAGISVAETRPVPFTNGVALAIRRFDRAAGRRLHALSANVALKAAGAELSYPGLALLLRRRGPVDSHREQMRELFRRLVFNILIDNALSAAGQY